MEQKKPTKAAFLLNRLVREYPGEIAGLVMIGERLTAAHHGGDAAALREAIAEQRALVYSLRTKAAALSTKLHVAPGEISAVSAALYGVTTSPERAVELERGRLSKPPEATASFGGDLGGFAAAAPVAPRTRTLEKKPEPVQKKDDEHAAVTAAAAALKRLQTLEREARAAFDAADSRAEQAEARRTENSDEVSALKLEEKTSVAAKAQLEKARLKLDEAQKKAATLSDDAEELRARHRDSERPCYRPSEVTGL